MTATNLSLTCRLISLSPKVCSSSPSYYEILTQPWMFRSKVLETLERIMPQSWNHTFTFLDGSRELYRNHLKVWSDCQEMATVSWTMPEHNVTRVCVLLNACYSKSICTCEHRHSSGSRRGLFTSNLEEQPCMFDLLCCLEIFQINRSGMRHIVFLKCMPWFYFHVLAILFSTPLHFVSMCPPLMIIFHRRVWGANRGSTSWRELFAYQRVILPTARMNFNNRYADIKMVPFYTWFDNSPDSISSAALTVQRNPFLTEEKLKLRPRLCDGNCTLHMQVRTIQCNTVS